MNQMLICALDKTQRSEDMNQQVSISRYKRALYISPVLALVLLISGCATYEPHPLTKDAVDTQLTVPEEPALIIATQAIAHPLLKPVVLDASDGLSPDEAAILAVLLNPELKAARSQIKEGQAQLLQAGILPNPQIGANLDFVVGGNTVGTQTAQGFGLSWDLQQLLTRNAAINSAKASEQAIRLDLAWQEWQVAIAARAGILRLSALADQIEEASQIAERLTEETALLKESEQRGLKTLLDVAPIEASANSAASLVLSLKSDYAQARIELNRIMGYPAETLFKLQEKVPTNSITPLPHLDVLLSGFEERRLDLLALKFGYESQDARLRSAILAQFPSINLGLNAATDTGNVQTLGPGVGIGIPLFDRNQGNISMERATRERLFNEYASRVFQARTDIVAAYRGITSLSAQITQAHQALPTLRQIAEVSKGAAESGNMDRLTQYTIQNDLTAKTIELSNLQLQLELARTALEAAAAWHLEL